MIRRIALATAAITATALIPGITWTASAQAVAPAPDQTVSVPNGTVIDVLLDQAAGLLFISGSNGVAVTNLDGTGVSLISGTAQAQSMALGPDGQVYATIATTTVTSQEIVQIDPTSKSIVKSWPIGSAACPGDIAFAGSDLWFGYSCGQESANNPTPYGIAHLDTTTGTVTEQLQHAHDLNGSTSFLASVPGNPGELVVTNPGPKGVALVAVAGAQATVVHQVDQYTSFVSPVVTPDGSKVVTADTSMAREYALPDLTPVATFPYSAPNGIAFSPDSSYLALSSQASFQPTITTYDYPAGTARHQYQLSADAYTGSYPGYNGMVWNGDTLLSVTTDGSGRNSTLHILNSALIFTPTLTLSSPPSVGRAKPIRITANLSGVADGSVLVAKRDAAGAHPIGTFTTDANGNFAFTDTPAVGGVNTYVAVYAGDDMHAPVSAAHTITVLRGTPVLTMQLDSHLYNYRQPAHLSVHLGSHDVKKVQIWVKAGTAPLHYYTTLTVNSQGNAAMAMAMSYNTVFAVKFYGDYYYNARVISTSVQTRAGVAVAMAGNYGSSGGYALYHAGSTVYVGGAVGPTKPGQCLRFDYYGYVNGAWSLGASDTCVKIQSDGVAASGLQGAPVGIPLRVRAAYHGDSYNAGNYSGWAYFMLR